MSGHTAQIVKARTSKHCIWCSEPIKPGEKYQRVSWVDGDTYGRNNWHLECVAAHDAACKADSDFAEYWNDEGCPSYPRGHSHEPNYSSVAEQAAAGCPACLVTDGEVKQ